MRLHCGKTIQSGTTLVMFDEIQECGRAITAMKYFCENAQEYHIVCAGSLLGIALQKQLSFPVGKVDFLTLHPMSFLEYLRAGNAEALANYIRNYKKGDTLLEVVSDKLEVLLKRYYVTGGMPEVVETWFRTNSIDQMESVQ